MTYYLPLADGSWGSFEDSVPHAVAVEKVFAFNNPPPPPPPVEKPYFAFGSGIDRTQANLYSAAEGVGRTTGLDGLADWARRGKEANIAEAEVGLPPAQQQSFTDANSATDYLKALTQAASATALPTAIGVAGGMLGGSLLGPGGTLAGGIAAATAGGTLAGVPTLYGQHRMTQETERPGQPVEEGRAFAAAVPAAFLDALGNVVTFGLATAAGRGLTGAAKAEAVRLATEETGAALLPRSVKGVGVGIMAEAPTEFGQAVLDRWQARQDLTSPEAFADYKEQAMGGGAVGGLFGGAHRAAFGARAPAAGTRGGDPHLRGALEELQATAPPGPTVTLPAAAFNTTGVDTGVGVNTTTAPLAEWTNYVALKYPDAVATAEATALAAHRAEVGDPAATLSEGAVATVRKDHAVGVAADQMTAAIAAVPGLAKAAELQTATNAIAAAQKDLAALITASETGTISERIAHLGAVAKAKTDLAAAIDAKTAIETTAAAEAATAAETKAAAAAKITADEAKEAKAVADAAGGETAVAAQAFNEDVAAATPDGLPQDMASVLARNAEEMAARDTAAGDTRVADASRGFPAGVPDTALPLTPEQQRAANVAANVDATAAITAGNEALAAERAASPIVAEASRGARPPNSFPSPTHPQASTRGAVVDNIQTTSSAADPALAAAETAALTARRDKALAVINDRLEKMRGRGAQGAAVASTLDAELARGVLTPAESYAAFKASEILTTLLPAGANHDIAFVPRILATTVSPEALAASGGAGQATLPATRAAPTTTARGLISLSLEPQHLNFMQENAAHEAFHVVQDYIASYDPSAARQLARDFRDGMSLANVEGTLRRKLELAKMPTGESYWASLQETFGDKTLSSGEMQAYIFGALTDANRRGVPMTGLKPVYTRLVLALRQFFQKLGSALRGDGFTNTADMLGRIGEGDARRFDARAAPLGTGEVQVSARAVSPEHAAAIAKIVGNRAVTARDSLLARVGRQISGAGSETSIYGGAVQPEKFGDALIRNTSNVAHPFYILQNTLNRAGKWIGGPDIGRAIEQATMTATQLTHLINTGQLRYDVATRDFVPVANSKGLIQILTPVGSSVAAQDGFQAYSVALRERDHRAAGNARFHNLTETEITTVIQETERTHPEWKQVAADLQTYNDSLMNLLVDSGLIRPAQADNLKSMFYTPFFRQMETDAHDAPGQALGVKMSRAINNPKAFAQTLEGGVAPVEPLYSSLAKNTNSILRAASKNIAMHAATDAMIAG